MSGRLQNQLVTVSEMSDKVFIATRSETVDDFGALLNDMPEPTEFMWGKVRYDSTAVSELNDQQKFTTNIKVWTRYSENWTDEKVVFWNDKYYNIYAIETTPGLRFHVIKARLIET